MSETDPQHDDASGLRYRDEEEAEARCMEREGTGTWPTMTGDRIVSRTTTDELLARARRRLDRVTAGDALDAVREGAVLVDIRSEVQRERDGLIPGAIFHPRNVLEWRCDASSGHDDPRLSGDLGRRIILVCNEGYQSSLAAATLQDLGFARATDLVGGFRAWATAGLPVVSDVDEKR